MTPLAENGSSPVRERCGQKMNIALEQLRGGELENAIITLRNASQIDPSYFAPWFNLGLAYKHSRNWPSALDAFDAAWARLPPDAA